MSGSLTQARLAVDELRQGTDIPVLNRGALSDPATASALLVAASARQKVLAA